MRSREWRRRIGGDGQVCGQTFDDSVDASGDDGRWRDDGIGSCGQFSPTLAAFDIGQSGGLFFNSWFRWHTVTVPAGATIEACTITVQTNSGSWDGAGVKTNLQFCDEDDSAQPTSCVDIRDRARTSAVAWDDQDFSAGDNTTPDLTTQLQEVIDRGGWASGQAIQLVWVDDGSTNGKFYDGDAYDSAGNPDADLHIQYCA